MDHKQITIPQKRGTIETKDSNDRNYSEYLKITGTVDNTGSALGYKHRRKN